MDSTTIGVLGGTGPAGSAVAVRLAAAGFTVLLGSREASKAEAKVDELRARYWFWLESCSARRRPRFTMFTSRGTRFFFPPTAGLIFGSATTQ